MSLCSSLRTIALRAAASALALSACAPSTASDLDVRCDAAYFPTDIYTGSGGLRAVDLNGDGHLEVYEQSPSLTETGLITRLGPIEQGVLRRTLVEKPKFSGGRLLSTDAPLPMLVLGGALPHTPLTEGVSVYTDWSYTPVTRTFSSYQLSVTALLGRASVQDSLLYRSDRSNLGNAAESDRFGTPTPLWDSYSGSTISARLGITGSNGRPLWLGSVGSSTRLIDAETGATVGSTAISDVRLAFETRIAPAGATQLVVLDGTGNLLALDRGTLSLRWPSFVTGVTAFVPYDRDHDGVDELLLATSNGTLEWRDAGGVFLGGSAPLNRVYRDVSIGDVGGGDAIFGSDNSSRGIDVWSLALDRQLIAGNRIRGPFTVTGTTRVNGKKLDLVLQNTDQGVTEVQAIDAATALPLWKVSSGSASFQDNYKDFASGVVAGAPRVFIVGAMIVPPSIAFQSGLVVVDPASGTVVSRSIPLLSGRIPTRVFFADVDGDGQPELVVLSVRSDSQGSGPVIHLIDPATLAERWASPALGTGADTFSVRLLRNPAGRLDAYVALGFDGLWKVDLSGRTATHVLPASVLDIAPAADGFAVLTDQAINFVSADDYHVIRSYSLPAMARAVESFDSDRDLVMVVFDDQVSGLSISSGQWIGSSRVLTSRLAVSNGYVAHTFAETEPGSPPALLLGDSAAVWRFSWTRHEAALFTDGFDD